MLENREIRPVGQVSVMPNKHISMTLVVPLVCVLVIGLYLLLTKVLPMPFLVSFAVFFSVSLSSEKRRAIAQKVIVLMVALHLVASVSGSTTLNKLQIQLSNQENIIVSDLRTYPTGEGMALNMILDITETRSGTNTPEDSLTGRDLYLFTEQSVAERN